MLSHRGPRELLRVERFADCFADEDDVQQREEERAEWIEDQPPLRSGSACPGRSVSQLGVGAQPEAKKVERQSALTFATTSNGANDTTGSARSAGCGGT
jgi:hypothetical protein